MQIIFYGALTCCFVVMSLQDQNFSILEISEKFLRAAPDAESEATLDMSNGCSQEEHRMQASDREKITTCNFQRMTASGARPTTALASSFGHCQAVLARLAHTRVPGPPVVAPAPEHEGNASGPWSAWPGQPEPFLLSVPGVEGHRRSHRIWPEKVPCSDDFHLLLPSWAPRQSWSRFRPTL